MDNYVYMIGIDLDYWTTDDDKACKQYKVDCKGYYKLGTDEGFILVGTLKNLKKLLEDYFGVAIVDEYLTEYDYFDFEDGDWVIGGWNESKKSVRKSLNESKEYNFDYFYQLLKDDKHFSVNYAHDDLPDDDTVYANGTVDVKWFIDGKRLNHSAILSIPCFSMVFAYEGLLFNCEHASRYNSVIGYADISDVHFTSDVLSLLLVNGLRITFDLY